MADLLEKHKGDQKFKEFLRIHKRNSFEEWNLDSILNVGKEFEEQVQSTTRLLLFFTDSDAE